jgi:hypothetical protein
MKVRFSVWVYATDDEGNVQMNSEAQFPPADVDKDKADHLLSEVIDYLNGNLEAHYRKDEDGEGDQ